MTDLPVLYSFRRCPYAMRARMAVAVSGVKVELREVVLRDKPPKMLEVSAKGTVPVLVTSDGETVEESIDIMHWAMRQHDSENWLAYVDEDLIAANDGPFKQALDRYKYPDRYDLTEGDASRDSALAYLGVLNDRLSANAFLGRDMRGFTDIALFPFVRQFAATDQDWFDGLPLPELQRWMAGLLQSDLFAAIMTRYPRWMPANAPTIFP